MSDKKKRYMLPEEEIPHYWYNIQADMVNKPMPPLHPGTKQPLKAEDLYPCDRFTGTVASSEQHVPVFKGKFLVYIIPEINQPQPVHVPFAN